jgi:homocitrate synthase NifV
MLSPEGYGERVAAVVRAAPIDVQCHAHNDFGLGTANALAGLRAGARFFHVTVNAIGERAGMADLSQMVMILRKLYDRDLGIDTTKLRALSDLVGRECKVPVSPWQPVIGRNVFAHESGIHVNGMLDDTSTFEPFPPEDVGGERRYVLGKHSGRALIKWALEEQRVAYRDDLLESCLQAVRRESVRTGGAVDPCNLRSLYAQVEATLGVAR